MSECSAVVENMPLLLVESLGAEQRELAHQHIERCPECTEEWAGFRETWKMMDALPEVEVPARVREQFLQSAGIAERPHSGGTIVPFLRRPAAKWLAQAAAVAVLAGGGYFAGSKRVTLEPQSATINSVTPVQQVSTRPTMIAESRVLDADNVSPEIQGRPNIENVQFVDANPDDDNQIGVSFDITSRWTVKGNPKDKSMVRLLSYVLQRDGAMSQRSNAIDWVRRTYSDPANADPEIANALAKVLRNDAHEGVRIHAVEGLTNLPPAVSLQTRDALIQALNSDPNPAVRIKAVEALANMVRNGETLDPTMVDTLRQKASQNDENLYVRVKAAEALSSIKPQ